jgi:hypothetical protein
MCRFSLPATTTIAATIIVIILSGEGEFAEMQGSMCIPVENALHETV